jgi:hypothetical protein
MESAGYEVPMPEEAPQVNVYGFENYRFALTEEVVESDDGLNYVRLDQLDENYSVNLDESGEEILVEFVEFDEEDYILAGLFENEQGELFACMLSESDLQEMDPGEEEEDEEEEEYEEEDEDED